MQNIKKLVIRFSILICFASSTYFGVVNGGETFNVLNYGAVGDGKHYDSEVNIWAVALCVFLLISYFIILFPLYIYIFFLFFVLPRVLHTLYI